MKLKPIFSNIIVEPIQADEKTSGGIYIPDSVRLKEMPSIGVVISIPESGRFILQNHYVKYVPQVNVGDVVMYERHKITPITFEDKEYLIMREDNIYTRVEENNNSIKSKILQWLKTFYTAKRAEKN